MIGHLRSPDLLRLRRVSHRDLQEHQGRDEGRQPRQLDGDLTIRDVTRPVVLDAEFQGSAKSPGTTSYGFSASTKINREGSGLNWNVALETGGVLVGKEYTLTSK